MLFFCYDVFSVPCSIVITCWEMVDLLGLLCVGLLLFCHFPVWCSGSVMVLDCIDSWSLPPSLLFRIYSVTCICEFISLTFTLKFSSPFVSMFLKSLPILLWWTAPLFQINSEFMTLWLACPNSRLCSKCPLSPWTVCRQTAKAMARLRVCAVSP